MSSLYYYSKLKVLVVVGCIALLAQEPLFAQDSGVSGRVIDIVTKRPVAGAEVTAVNRSGDTVGTAEANEAGEYVIASVYSGLVSVIVTADQYRAAERVDVRLFKDKVTTSDFSLREFSNVEEILVTGRPFGVPNDGSVTAYTLTREEIRRTPGTAGDIFRGLSTLPGVAATGAFSSFSVRGRGPRDNIILIDGIPYDRAVHFDQSLGEADDIGGGGRFSIFGQNVVGRADFAPGGWSSEFGGANGSLLRLDLAEGSRNNPFIEAKFDLAGGEVLYDGPSYAFDNTSLLVSLRYYDFGQLFDIIGQEDIGRPELADALVKSVTRFDADTTLKLIGLYTPERYTRDLDNVLASPDFDDPTLLTSEQDAFLLGATLEQLVGETGQWTNAVYYRYASDDSQQGEAFPELSATPSDALTIPLEESIIALNEGEKELGWRSDYSADNGLGRFKIGSRLVLLNIDYQQTLSRDYPLFVYDRDDFRPDRSDKFILLTPSLFNASLTDDSVRATIYGEQSFDIGAVRLTAGARGEYDSLLSVSYLSPRLQIEWAGSERTLYKITGGLYTQAPRLLEIAANQGNLDLGYEKTWQASAGVNHFFGADYQLQLEGYYQRMTDLIPDSDRVTGKLTNDSKGWAAGFDTILRKKFSNDWSASLRYSYNRVRIDDGDGAGYRQGRYSRPHLANFTMSYEISDSWSVGLQYQIASGRPSERFIINEDVYANFGLTRFSREITRRFDGRFPTFQTLNLRADYRRQIGGVVVKGFIDIVNALGRKNVDYVEFSPITGEIDNDGLGVFPQLGLAIEF